MSQFESIDKVLKKERLELQEAKRFNNNSNNNSNNNTETKRERIKKRYQNVENERKEERRNERKNQKLKDNRKYVDDYTKKVAKNTNTTPGELRKRFKGATYGSEPFAKRERQYDMPSTDNKGNIEYKTDAYGKKSIKKNPKYFDQRVEYGVDAKTGKIDPLRIRDRQANRIASATYAKLQRAKNMPVDKAGDAAKIKAQKVAKAQKAFDRYGARGSEQRKRLLKIVDRINKNQPLDTGTGKNSYLYKIQKDYLKVTNPTVKSKFGKPSRTVKGVKYGGTRVPMKGGFNAVDFDPAKPPKPSQIDSKGFASLRDSKGKEILGKNNKPLRAKVYSGTPAQQKAFKKKVTQGKDKFFKKVSKFGSPELNRNFVAAKAQQDIGGIIAPKDPALKGMTAAQKTANYNLVKSKIDAEDALRKLKKTGEYKQVKPTVIRTGRGPVGSDNLFKKLKKFGVSNKRINYKPSFEKPKVNPKITQNYTRINPKSYVGDFRQTAAFKDRVKSMRALKQPKILKYATKALKTVKNPYVATGLLATAVVTNQILKNKQKTKTQKTNLTNFAQKENQFRNKPIELELSSKGDSSVK